MRRTQSGFPWLDPEDHYEFPDRESADSNGIVGVGGNLSPGMLLSAYRQGVFPWFNAEDPIIWWSPDPRFIIYIDEVHESKSMRRLLHSGRFHFSLDTQFAAVIHACAVTPRRGQSGTWITEEMELGYRRLHELGFAHSCEVWDGARLVGGLYGLALGRMFFAESMYSHADNTSKAALITMARFLGSNGFDVIDSQLHNPHVERMGGRVIPRREFLQIVEERVHQPGLPTSWTDLLCVDLNT